MNADPFAETPPPNAIELERALLASLMAQNAGIEQVADNLAPSHFFDQLHADVYAAMVRLWQAGKPATPLTLKGEFEANHLAEIAGYLISAISNREYAEAIRATADRRRLIEIADELRHEAESGAAIEDVTTIREKAEAALFAVGNETTTGRPSTLGDVARETLDFIDEQAAAVEAGGISGVPTGLRNLDNMLGGLQPSDLVILAGRPSMGKTALGLTVSLSASRDENDDGAILLFSLEMSKLQVGQRILSNAADVSYSSIVQGRIDQSTRLKLHQTADELRHNRYVIDDRPGATVARIRSEARRVARKAGLKLIVIDYLGFVTAGPEYRGNKILEIAQITAGLKAIAKELNVPVLLLSQLSRAVEQRDDKRPLLSDLRDSGAIEQDADVVLFVYREQYYLERAEPAQKPTESTAKFGERYAAWQDRLNATHGMADVIVAKARRGRVGTVTCRFDGDRQRFTDGE